jgi:hypothetical protein
VSGTGLAAVRPGIGLAEWHPLPTGVSGTGLAAWRPMPTRVSGTGLAAVRPGTGLAVWLPLPSGVPECPPETIYIFLFFTPFGPAPYVKNRMQMG